MNHSVIDTYHCLWIIHTQYNMLHTTFFYSFNSNNNNNKIQKKNFLTHNFDCHFCMKLHFPIYSMIEMMTLIRIVFIGLWIFYSFGFLQFFFRFFFSFLFILSSSLCFSCVCEGEHERQTFHEWIKNAKIKKLKQQTEHNSIKRLDVFISSFQ